MKYEISLSEEGSKYLQLKYQFKKCKKEETIVRIPAWRPGRYELQNFAQYIRRVKGFDSQGNALEITKINKDAWKVTHPETEIITITYEFYADIPNAGGSVIQKDFLYVNPVNCCMYIEERLDELCEILVKFIPNQNIACGMPHKKTTDGTIFFAKNFHDLADSPFFITSRLHHIQYQSFETNFHIWIKGAGEFPLEKIETDFKKFTETQIQIFGEFPEEDFHFMLWLSPEASYHGVEHSRSTMMTLGPTTENFDDLYTDLLGLASHELFHAWNIKRIRPKELLPYDYSKENYFTTCFVAEGITTFYGDWILYRSGVFDRKAYHKELESTLRRHFETADQADLSLLESSYDLWLDGYKRGVPERKVSVYHKGATAGLILNHLISEKTNGQQNLDDLMKLLWNRHGKPFIGYSYNDFRLATEEIAGQSFEWYFKTIIESNLSIFETCNEALKGDNFELRRNENGFIQLIDLSPS